MAAMRAIDVMQVLLWKLPRVGSTRRVARSATFAPWKFTALTLRAAALILLTIETRIREVISCSINTMRTK